MNGGRSAFIPLPGKFIIHRICLFTSERRNGICWRYAAMPQNIDGAIAWWRKASGAATGNRLIMRLADAAKRRRIALPPS
jgi:hypothetical protein